MRLTEVMTLFNDRMYQMPNNKSDYSSAVVKLGQLEDIEEELGIDLITLFKALKNGIWVKIFPKLKNGGSIIRVPCMLSIVEIGGGVDKSFGLEFYVNTKRRYLVLDTRRDNDLKDYGKTWALTKEELL